MKKVDKIFGKNIDLVVKEITEANPNKNWVPAYKFDIVLHNSNIIIGFCDARIGFNQNTYFGGNLGYHIELDYRGNGYAGEAVELMKQVFKMNGINKIYITNDPDNKASIRVCEKIGARFLELVQLPESDPQYAEGDRYKNIFELEF